MAVRTINGKNGNVTITDNSDFVMRQLQGALGDAAKDIAGIAVDAVHEQMLYGYHDWHGDPPHTEIVDTGRLYDSITADLKRVSDNAYTVSVGTDVPYAIYVHEGTYKLKGRPFITDAMSKSYTQIESAIARTLREKMKGEAH